MVVDRSFQGMGVKPFQKKSSRVKGRNIYAKQKVVLKKVYNITIFIIVTFKVP